MTNAREGRKNDTTVTKGSDLSTKGISPIQKRTQAVASFSLSPAS